MYEKISKSPNNSEKILFLGGKNDDFETVSISRKILFRKPCRVILSMVPSTSRSLAHVVYLLSSP
ncbi:MAG: hypothetical protein IKW78_03405, partial [Prevotella sp.]|nr:hypothetical protein [Prevotella sp.]